VTVTLRTTIEGRDYSVAAYSVITGDDIKAFREALEMATAALSVTVPKNAKIENITMQSDFKHSADQRSAALNENAAVKSK